MAWFPGIPDGPEDLEKFLQLKEMGVDVLCTNRPDIAILDLKNDWKLKFFFRRKIGSGFIKRLVNLLLNWFLHCKICNNILIFEYTSSMIQFDENSIIFLSDFVIRHSLFLMFCRKFAYISRDERRKIFYVTVAKKLTIWL